MKPLITWLSKPYFFYFSPKTHFLLGLGLGFFIFLFLLTFQPFGIQNLDHNIYLYAGGFGIVSFLIHLLFFVFCPLYFKKTFKNENWTVGKNILFLFFVTIFISLGNWYYNTLIRGEITTKSPLDFFLYTAALSFFPIIILTFTIERIYSIKKEKTSKEIMSSKTPKALEKQNNVVEIFGDNNNESILFTFNELLYISSQGNYVSFHLKKENTIEEKVIRSTLTKVQNSLKTYTNIVRCHKSYIINTNFIDSVSGNARGYYLNSNNFTNLIPISRKFSKKELLNMIK
ncbi:LytTR family transcriptional regulator [Polaribacter pectinis]|uniref:LytTR family transcriptional regulator n=1 Tax=Polaribacter pectinis TaxID=2738844 RepID=A0A7G9L8T9_9FLAO|nr:LytTR family DNA-binding domain-containing protein [Polaribacter pectinis]QNM85038.1 LytTR family transcriptional regulator [Polaribacter pectinis]